MWESSPKSVAWFSFEEEVLVWSEFPVDPMKSRETAGWFRRIASADVTSPQSQLEQRSHRIIILLTMEGHHDFEMPRNCNTGCRDNGAERVKGYSDGSGRS